MSINSFEIFSFCNGDAFSSTSFATVRRTEWVNSRHFHTQKTNNKKSRRDAGLVKVCIASAYVSTRTQPSAASRFNQSSDRCHSGESYTFRSPNDL